jgi:hypothetical protein
MKQMKKALIAIGIMAALGSMPAAQAEVVSIRFSGTILWGVDQLGLFGAQNRDLAGLSYAQTLATDLAQGYVAGSSLPGTSLYFSNVGNAAFNGSASVAGGALYGWTISHTDGDYALNKYVTNGLPGLDQVSIGAYGSGGTTPTGYQISAYNNLHSDSHAFLNSFDPYQRQVFNTSGLVADSFFRIEYHGLVTYFQADPNGGSVALNPIPEPESWAMLVLGLGVLGALARRRVRA